LRQGDPLAPFLFLVAVEGLAGLVRQGIKKNMLKGLKVGRKDTEVCMLQFANDTFFMCEDSYPNVMVVKVILRCIEIASGLKINFQKSRLAGINVERNSLLCYEKSLNCSLMRIPFIYLGMEVGGN